MLGSVKNIFKRTVERVPSYYEFKLLSKIQEQFLAHSYVYFIARVIMTQDVQTIGFFNNA